MKKTTPPPIDETEWAAQERALRAAAGHGADSLSGAEASYRVIADALATMPRSEPPADFAAAVMQRIAQRESARERLLSRGLLAGFVGVSVILCVVNADAGWQLIRLGGGDDTVAWVLLGLGCAALSWVGHRVREMASLSAGARHAA
ncbi:hypothetical protein [Arenimonas sp. MALMAid1274]|uniref:hypothetical protein n=1 Tax=Arenimonas sp. MALMAid1274 TaxID=3411630 RepID=UPI003B9EAA9F